MPDESGKKKAWVDNTFWDDLVLDPDGFPRRPGFPGGYQPITRLALQLVVDDKDFDPGYKMDERTLRLRRRAQNVYLRRTFTDDETLVVCTDHWRSTGAVVDTSQLHVRK